MAITQEQVSEAYVKIKTPILGMVFSAGLPLMLLAFAASVSASQLALSRSQA